jgi:hypothetical protein
MNVYDKVAGVLQNAATMMQKKAAQVSTIRVNYEEIARVCHEVNRAYCKALGDNSQPEWNLAPQWMRESALRGVQLHVENPDASAEASHISWMNQKLEEGWKYGPVKDMIKKEHPCMVPFHELNTDQQAKDHIFRQIVHSVLYIEGVRV